MTLRMMLAALAVSLAPTVATAKTIANQPGRFQIELSDDLEVVKHGRVPTEDAYMLIARSKRGNVKLFAKAATHRDPTVDLGKHLAAWEKMVRERGVYSSLRRSGKFVRRKALLAQMYRAEGTRVHKKHPYIVYVGISLDRKAERLYTFSVGSEASFFKANRARLFKLARTFRPYYGTSHAKNIRHSKKRISLRGKLKARRDGRVTKARN